jgi:hypothetical protein
VTADLTQRITAAMDKAERLANSSKPGPWWTLTYVGGEALPCMYIEHALPAAPVSTTVAVLYGTGREADAEHIAAWSPDRVLALIAADRRVLDRHTADRTQHEIDCEGGEAECERCENAWPCPDVLDLAARWGVTS